MSFFKITKVSPIDSFLEMFLLDNMSKTQSLKKNTVADFGLSQTF